MALDDAALAEEVGRSRRHAARMDARPHMFPSASTQNFEHGRHPELHCDAVVLLTAQIQSACIWPTVKANYSQQTGLACGYTGFGVWCLVCGLCVLLSRSQRLSYLCWCGPCRSCSGKISGQEWLARVFKRREGVRGSQEKNEPKGSWRVD